MNRLVLLSIFSICILLMIGCTREEVQEHQILMQSTTGSIIGNISPINVYDAEVTVLQDGKGITVVGVQDGIFQIENLSPGMYDLRVSALAYVTNDAIKGVKVVAGEATDVGRAVIFPEYTGEFIPTRITGTVLDARTGAPIAGASIKIECTEGICGILKGISDQAGRFEVAVWANLASIVMARKERYQTVRVEVVGIPTGWVQRNPSKSS